jgi:pentachlorophenol monooxygenase/3-(3-hydroxy-phenyl)propionate hydroxylase
VPAPGVLVPDYPVTVPGRPDVLRLRQLAREGVTVLVGDDAVLPALPDLAGDAGQGGPPLPVSVHRMGDLDPSGLLREALGARPDEVWVLRPDAHIAAVLTRSADVIPAVARLLARTVPTPVPA